MKWHLAQVNIGLARFAYEDSEMAGFVDNLDRLNAVADAAEGFVWRFIGDDETAVGRNVFGRDDLLFNMSLWKTRDALMAYVYSSDHVNVLRKRAAWFIQQEGPVLALWWQQAGTFPTPIEAKHRLDRLAQAGPTEDAFTFRRFYAAPTEVDSAHG